MPHTLSPLRRRLYGLAALGVLAAVLAATAASYQQVFTSAVMVTVQTERAGLLMNQGNDVTARGVVVGEVRRIAKTATGAALRVALRPDQADRIPTSSRARIEPSTVFGPKSVELLVPAGPVSDPVTDGAVLRAAEVAPEFNTVFEVFQQVLTTVQPAELNATLGSIANALSGRGARLGGYASQLEGYLQRFNPSLPALRTDIRSAADVADIYADAAPDLVETADNLASTSRTVVRFRGPLDSTLRALTGTAIRGGRFLDRLEEPLAAALAELRPTSELFAQYSPEFTCTIRGVNETRRRLESVFGAGGSDLNADLAFIPGQGGYQYPRDLPRYLSGDGPDCYGLPYVGRDEIPVPRVRFGAGIDGPFSQGSDRARVGTPPITFYEQLFGPFARDFADNLTGGGDE